MSSVKIAVLGAGTVGAQVVRLLGELSDDFAARVGADLRLIGVAVASLEKARPEWIDPALLTTDAESLVARADIVVELIGGIEPARSLITSALTCGASVVTGNKALMAAHGSNCSPSPANTAPICTTKRQSRGLCRWSTPCANPLPVTASRACLAS